MSPHDAASAVLLGCGVLGGWMLWRSAGRASVRRPWALAAVAVGVVLLVGPIDRLAETRSHTVHMLQLMGLFSVVPVLVLRAWRPARPAAPAMSAGRATALLALDTAAVWLVFVPPVYNVLLAQPALNDLSHLLALAAGIALAWPLMAPHALQGMGAVAYLVVAELAIGVLGMWLTWYPKLLYVFPTDAEALWGLSPRTDQALAGAVLLVVEEPFLAVEVAILFMAALKQSDEDAD